MKKIFSGVILLSIIALAVFVLIWALPTRELPSTNKQESYASQESNEQSQTKDSSVETTQELSDGINSSDNEKRYLDACIELIESGIYKQIIIEQKQIGGYSVPVKTVTYFGDGFINIIENEMHNISTEILINARGAYYFNEDCSEAMLLPTDSVTVKTFPYENLSYISSGQCVLGINTYSYERYSKADGTIIDYLFSNTKLKRLKIYTDESLELYETLTVEISADISDARSSLPYGILVTDKT